MDGPATPSRDRPQLLNALLAEDLDPLFWRPRRTGYDSAWTAHMPFAHWIVCAARPRMLVELGTYNGVSYSAFCEAVARARLATRCYAVDTWQGDDHAGHYGEEIFEDLRRFHEQHYGAFSELMRCTFDAALPYMPDGAIDLLHIDGRHGYDDVRHDFESWAPKLSDRAVVLFHDCNVRERGFGVWQFFHELRARYPAFEFLHEHGLGVVAVGDNVSADVAGLCGLTDPAVINAVRERFSQLGERWRVEVHLRTLGGLLNERNLQHASLEAERAAVRRESADGARMRAQSAQRAAEARDAAALAYQTSERLTAELATIRASTAAERAAAAVSEQAGKAAMTEAAMLRMQTEALRRDVGRLEATRDALLADRQALLASMSWRLTGPMRRTMRLKTRLRRRAAGALRHAWWTVTRQMAQRREAQAREAHYVGLLTRSGLFDAAWYKARYEIAGADPLLHFLRHGGAEGNDPGPLFDSAWYLRANPDVAQAGIVPLLHYLESGAAEGRLTRPVAEAPQAPDLPAFLRDAGRDAGRDATGRARRVVYVSGEPDTPGHIYRVQRAMAAAERTGAVAAWMPEPETEVRRDELIAADLLVVWRCAWTPRLGAAIETARNAGARIVFDLDDLMVAPELARRDLLDALRTEAISEADARGHYGRVLQAMLLADFCIASTDELAWHMRRHAKPTLVIPNGFDADTLAGSRLALRRRRQAGSDGLLRIGYASGSRTHQRDFARVADAVGRILHERADCRLVLFTSHIDKRPVLDPAEFPALAGLEAQIEWRQTVLLPQLPDEMARFDVNLAPLEAGNPFCETKSELKYFEAALAGVCTIASPTGPFRRAISHGRTGFIADGPEEWYAAIRTLLDDAALRTRMARAAYVDVLWAFGPERRRALFASALDQVSGGRSGERSFAFDARQPTAPSPAVSVPDSEILFAADRLGVAAVTVIVPSYNYAKYLGEALESVRTQTLAALDLIVVDDGSTDESAAIAVAWMQRHAARFNRAMVLRNLANAGLGATRNAGFAAAETQYALSLDADDRLLPDCCAALEREARATGADFVYPVMREFGEASGLVGNYPYVPAMLIGVPFIHANTLVSVAAWSGVGGFGDARLGWEDYEFWCRMAERGMAGRQLAGEPLAEYRVHRDSMLLATTESAANKPRVMAEITRLHPWLSLVDARGMPDLPPRED